MGIGVSILLIAAGAILTWGVTAEALANRGRQARRREHVLRRAMRVVEGAAVVVGRLH